MSMVVIEEPIAIPDLLSPLGLDLPEEGVPFDRWEALGANLISFARSHQWWVGDWLIYGEDRFGEEHAQGVDIEQLSGVEPKTLSNYRWVASRIPRRDRREALTWTHHRIAAELDTMNERRAVLKQAEKEDLSTRELQRVVDQMGDKEEIDRPDSNKTTKTFTLSYTVAIQDEKQGAIIHESISGEIEKALASRNVEPTKVSWTTS